tara:strand:- start:341 stop:817 length:477 start_codon:yes stop_codon:yes gene_type:complete
MDKLNIIKNKVTNVISLSNLAIIFVVAAILISTAVYYYKNYIKEKIKKDYVPNKEFVTGPRPDDVTTATLYFFYTDWCPHCKTAKPIWKTFKEQIGNNIIKDKKIKFVEVDCEKNGKVAEKYEVTGYPTIILTHGNKVIEYDAKTSIESLHQFLDTSL